MNNGRREELNGSKPVSVFEANLWISSCVLVIDGTTLGLILFVLSDGHLIQGPAHHGRDHPVFRIQLLQRRAKLYAIPLLYTHSVFFGVIKEVQLSNLGYQS